MTIGIYAQMWDGDHKRRQMYGAAGAFRPKTYGMEYRTLSNKWIFNPKIVDFVYRGVERALKLCFNPHYNPDDYYQRHLNEGYDLYPQKYYDEVGELLA